jgi:WD40 repeat protein
MRSLLTLCLLALLPCLARAEDKKSKSMQPIAVVELKRTDPVSYDKEVEPIFYKKCVACHSGPVKEAKFDISSYESMVKGGKRGPAIVPGKSAQSMLCKLAGKSQKPLMPPKLEEPLTPDELALIKLWIDQGAKAPTGMRVRPKVLVGVPPPTVHPVRAVAVSPDKSAVAAGRGNQIHVYDAGSGTYIRTLTDPGLVTADQKPVRAAHLTVVESLAFSPDGKYLASGAYQEVKIWDVQTGMIRHKLTGFADRVMALAFAPTGKYLATGGGAPTEDGEIKVFEVPSWNLALDVKANCHSDTVFGVCFSPDATKLATCGADKFVKVFEVPGGKFLKSFEGHTHHVLDVGWRFDGKVLASAGADNVVKVWNYDTGEQTRTIPAHGKQVTRLLFVGKTPQFLTCSGDQQVRLWNSDTGGNTGNYSGSTDFVYAVGVSPDGTVVASGGEEGIVRLYKSSGQPFKLLLPPDAAPATK